jgi:hypothetical protein
MNMLSFDSRLVSARVHTSKDNTIRGDEEQPVFDQPSLSGPQFASHRLQRRREFQVAGLTNDDRVAISLAVTSANVGVPLTCALSFYVTDMLYFGPTCSGDGCDLVRKLPDRENLKDNDVYSMRLKPFSGTFSFDRQIVRRTRKIFMVAALIYLYFLINGQLIQFYFCSLTVCLWDQLLGAK